MAFKIIIISFAALFIQNINGQYISNVGSVGATLRPNAASVPISLATSPATTVVANSAAIGAPISISNPTVVSPVASVGFANSAISTGGLGVGNPISPLSLSTGAISSGGPSVLSVTSTSPIAPNGVSVFADSIYLEGPLAVSGQLPYLGTISFDGSLPSSGQGVASCGCGNGKVGMVSEGPAGIGGSVAGGFI